MDSLPMTPLFVVGTGRSGTTVVADTIARSPAVLKLDRGEPKLFSDMNGFAGVSAALYSSRYTQRFLRSRTDFFHKRDEGSQDVGFFQYIDKETFETLLTEFWVSLDRDDLSTGEVQTRIRQLYATLFSELAIDEGARYFLDDTPINALRIKEIVDTFPEARILHVIRDGRHVAHGHLRLGWCASYHEGLHLWRSRIDAARHVVRNCGISDERYREIGFERLLASPGAMFGSVFDWIGLDFDESYLDEAQFSGDKVSSYAVTPYEDALFRALAADLVAEFDWV